MLLRLTVGLPLIYGGYTNTLAGGLASLPDLGAALAGMLLIGGLFTTQAGVAAVIAELWMIINNRSPVDTQWLRLGLGALGASMAMLGPGACSVDAARFGRKVFEIGQGARSEQKGRGGQNRPLE